MSPVVRSRGEAMNIRTRPNVRSVLRDGKICWQKQGESDSLSSFVVGSRTTRQWLDRFLARLWR